MRRHLKSGHYDSAILVASKWPRLGDARIAVRAAYEAVKYPSDVRNRGEDPGQLIIDGVHALKKHLKMKD